MLCMCCCVCSVVDILLYALFYCLRAGSLTESGCRLTASKPECCLLHSSTGVTDTVMTYFCIGAEDLNSGPPHAHEASDLTH